MNEVSVSSAVRPSSNSTQKVLPSSSLTSSESTAYTLPGMELNVIVGMPSIKFMSVISKGAAGTAR